MAKSPVKWKWTQDINRHWDVPRVGEVVVFRGHLHRVEQVLGCGRYVLQPGEVRYCSGEDD